jgi:hypothetical protein
MVNDSIYAFYAGSKRFALSKYIFLREPEKSKAWIDFLAAPD